MLSSVVLVGAALLGQAKVSASSEWAARYSFPGPARPPARWLVTEGYSVAAEAQVLVFQRIEQLPMPRQDPLRRELVCVDLGTGQERAVLQMSGGGGDHITTAISRDGSTIAILRQSDSRVSHPYMVSIWHPISDSDTLHDYKQTEVYNTPERGGRYDMILGVGGLVSLSPDGKAVAYLVRVSHAVREREESEAHEASENEGIGILDLETGQVSAINLPFKRLKSPTDWRLAWSSDGSTVYASLHGEYEPLSETRTPEGGAMSVTTPPSLSLYRCSPKDQSATLIGALPKGILRFDGYDNLVILPPFSENGPQPSSPAFATLPLSQLQGRGDRVATTFDTVRADARIEGVDLAGVESIQIEDVFPGPTRTYVLATVNNHGQRHRVVLERRSASARE